MCTESSGTSNQFCLGRGLTTVSFEPSAGQIKMPYCCNLCVYPRSKAWTAFIVHQADALPDSILEKLMNMGFEPEIEEDVAK
jgi:hypothetical protein